MGLGSVQESHSFQLLHTEWSTLTPPSHTSENHRQSLTARVNFFGPIFEISRSLPWTMPWPWNLFDWQIPKCILFSRSLISRNTQTARTFCYSTKTSPLSPSLSPLYISRPNQPPKNSRTTHSTVFSSALPNIFSSQGLARFDQNTKSYLLIRKRNHIRLYYFKNRLVIFGILLWVEFSAIVRRLIIGYSTIMLSSENFSHLSSHFFLKSHLPIQIEIDGDSLRFDGYEKWNWVDMNDS